MQTSYGLWCFCIAILPALTAGCGGSSDDDASSDQCVQTGGGESIRLWLEGSVLHARYDFTLDSEDRPFEASTDGQTQWSYEFDAQGNLTRFTARDAVVDYQNDYDAQGRLSRVVRSDSRSPGYDTTTTYSYEDGSVPERWTRQVYDDPTNSISITRVRTFQNGLRSRVESTQNGKLSMIHDYSHENGKLAEIDYDGPVVFGSGDADGSVDVRWSFGYENDQQVRFKEQALSGEGLGFEYTYSAACGELLTRFPWLGHVPGPDLIEPPDYDAYR